jgi:hypothetical protein
MGDDAEALNKCVPIVLQIDPEQNAQQIVQYL